MPDDSTPLRTEEGKKMLAHALSDEYCVLEFNEMDDGSMHVVDITEHVKTLEEWAREEGFMDV